ncbi:MAG: DegV family EDD domain-containing protein [Treponema sp.]|nr:DegV family EDD domain-containing protein [Treponema sp.]
MIRQWLKSIRDPEVELQDRMFRLLTGIALFTLFLMILFNVVIMEHLVDTVCLAAGFIFFSAVYFISISKKRTDIGGTIIALVINLIMMPVIFLTGGGVYGGAPVWLVFCSLYVCLVVPGKRRILFLFISIAVSLISFLVAYFYPEFLPQHTLTVAFVDSLTGVIAVTLLLSLMVIFQATLYENENSRAKAQAKEIEEMNRAQSRFFSSMSHEIRTPINTIIGLDEMILREPVSEEVAEDARRIQLASKMLLSLINDILDLSKIESGKMDIVPVSYETGVMLSEIVNMIWIRARQKGLEFHIDVDPAMPSMLFGDEVRIKQILLNILNNAIKYTQKGSVTLSIQCKKLAANRVEMTYMVEDTGMGIKKESIPYLFDAFKRVDEETNRNIEGTGLGLAIVKQLLDLMGGSISVNSIYTKGTTFTVTVEQDIVDAHEVGELNLETRHSLNAYEHYKQSFEAPAARILIVDDNESNLMVASKLLRGTKVQTDTVLSGLECLKKTESCHYDVILMDHLMPEMDGIECLHAVRSQVGGLCTRTPVVALTANAGNESQTLYAKEGFDAYLVKPVNAALLEACVLKLLPRELVVFTNASEEDMAVYHLKTRHKERVPLLITTDSICDLPRELIERYHIPVLPYLVYTEQGVFMDGMEADSDGVLAYVSGRKVRNTEKGIVKNGNAHSDAPSVEAYESFFAEQLTRSQYVIHITMTSKSSSGYANACMAARSFHNVRVIDSCQLSSGTGLLVLYACSRLQSREVSIYSLVEELEVVKRRINTSFIVDTTEYLARSGRISERVSGLCRTLLLHPVISLNKGKMGLGSIRLGRRSNAWKSYIHSTLKGAPIDTSQLFITYAGLNHDELEEIRQEIERVLTFEHLYFVKASPAIAINCGPGTFGLLFIRR